MFPAMHPAAREPMVAGAIQPFVPVSAMLCACRIIRADRALQWK